MNQDIINLYEITFNNKLISISGGPSFFTKVISTNNLYLTDFLMEWNSEEITQYLIPEINKVINGIEPEFETGSETVSITIGSINTIFFIDNVDTNYPRIPTVDLKEIIIGWKNYLDN
ncbi:hypothetical protein [Flavobacterium sp. AG291]|uniref:hypothetical protein n=1 Tax=Flavobacterium sp. AG291 TaxID=2184000 RepID=UPI000E0BFFE8|nr:hypothetical protein [Flavobacterium sp. AG291]RDI13323.1 hypothetical protein DEU42_103234 [Flavobacterium sp. AG291]